MVDEYAFPYAGDAGIHNAGMTIRDYFAAHAIDHASFEEMMHGSYKHYCEAACAIIAKHAYMVADAMLKAREAQ